MLVYMIPDVNVFSFCPGFRALLAILGSKIEGRDDSLETLSFFSKLQLEIASARRKMAAGGWWSVLGCNLSGARFLFCRFLPASFDR